MEYRQLPHGTAAEKFSVIGLGLGGIGQTPADEIEAIIRKAIDHGINFFDLCTAGATYAPLGRAIAGKREAPLVVPMATAAELAAEEAAGAQIGESAWYQKWWVWTIVGVVVAGAVTGGVIYALSDQTGTVPVTVTLR